MADSASEGHGVGEDAIVAELIAGEERKLLHAAERAKLLLQTLRRGRKETGANVGELRWDECADSRRFEQLPGAGRHLRISILDGREGCRRERRVPLRLGFDFAADASAIGTSS